MSLAYSEPRIQEGEEKEELRAILESGILKRAPNLQHFLEFVAAEYFAGNADQVKEYSIAVHALHRPEQFDPQSDTIVRVTAYALRKKLEQYYATDGARHEVQIHLPAGKYILQFVRKEREPVPEQVAEEAHPDVSLPVEETPKKFLVKPQERQFWLWFGVATAVILISVGVYVVKQRRPEMLFKAGNAQAAGTAVAAGNAVGGENPAAGRNAVASGEAGAAMRIRFSGNRLPYVDAAGQSWITEDYCKGGSNFARPGQSIEGTDDPTIFREGRKRKFQCRIPVPPGICQLQLLFADSEGTKVNAGYVDFNINNRTAGANRCRR